ncbi:MAG: hypothetical protein ACOYB4_06025 [Methyloceanibacter sp.]
MKHRGLALVLCVAAGLAVAPYAAQAFEVQGQDASLSDGASQFNSLNQGYVLPEFKGHSLAMPFINNSDGGGHVSDYGNAIPIPGPGISLPSPAWAYGPGFRR